MTTIKVTTISEFQNGQSIVVDMVDVFLSKAAPNRYSSTHRMLKMTTQQGRRELGNRSVILFHPPTPSCQDSSVTGRTLQGDERLRTTLEEERVSARRGRVGEKKVIFSILLRPILRCLGISKQ